MEIRATRSADLPRLHDIFRRATGELFGRYGLAAPTPSLEVFAAQQQHLLDHDGERCAVAAIGGEPIGYGSAWRRGDEWFLASLYVEPEAQAGGVGARLLDAIWDACGLRRRTITDAIQPVSNALYARRGLIPTTPLLAFSGAPRSRVPPQLEAVPVTDESLLELDLAAYGFDRAPDHAYWARVAERTLWLRDGRPVAYAYRFADGTIGPVAGVSGLDAGEALAAELGREPKPSPPGVALPDASVRVRIPGSARELVAAALAAGLRLGSTPGLLLLGPGAEPPRALAVASYTLL